MNETRGPRWPWIAHLNFWDDHSQFLFLLLSEKNLQEFQCLYSASSPHSLMPCLLTDQNFCEQFLKGSPKEHFCEIISKSDKWFQRRILKNFSEVHTVQKASPHGGYVFRRIKISRTLFEKGHPRNNPVKLFQNLTKRFQRRRILKNFSEVHTLKKASPPMAVIFFNRSNIRENFWKGSPKEQSCEIIPNSDQWFRRRRFFKNFFKSI